ncbi:hypothetical protein TGGT1_275860 [Toxoplasma gondii GT1]|uniref:Dense granule protein GRA12 n=3 Tax=Toxoplasma gondii TaxID=5811 RepID=S7UNG6_TOXGG|nr:hypothetical protein TGGT1_275860 [Toxoplasma gondii GT1]KAF4645492.1 hypothetical protein TGRH88_005960 [Toxoplasma gondii]KFG37270.1 putative dense granule protein GRA12 [Toxoplasma gondii FOU]
MDVRYQTRGAVAAVYVLFRTVVGAVLGLHCLKIVSAEVGLTHGIMSTEFEVELRGHNWVIDSGACLLGQPRNLVVDPVLDSEFMTPQKLLTDRTGPELCSWLEKIRRQHMEQKPAWLAAYQKFEKRFFLLRLLGMVGKPITFFPEFTVRIIVKHFSLWGDDRWGNAQPWIAATFEYAHPEGAGGELFLHIEKVFSMEFSGRVAKLVHILLNPSATFNQYVELHRRKRSGVPGDSGVSGIRRTLYERDLNISHFPTADTSQISHSLAPDILTLRFAKQDFWMEDGSCYILSRFVATSSIRGKTLCKIVSDYGHRESWMPFVGSRKKTVALAVTAADFFNTRRPSLVAHIKEGVKLEALDKTPVVLELVTDPVILRSYVEAARKA